MSADAVEGPPPIPAPRAPSEPLKLRRAPVSRSSLIANLAVAVACLAIVAMVAFYVLAGTP